MIDLDLQFKGSRTYLHGTDFFAAVSRSAPACTGDAGAYVSRLAFHRITRSAAALSCEPPTDAAAVVGRGQFRHSTGAESPFWLVETARPVVGRYAFDEDGLVATATFDRERQEAMLSNQASFTPIENIVALTKFLNYRVAPDVSGKWLFGQLDLRERLTADFRTLTVALQSSIASRFTVSSIRLDDRAVGTIRFIVGSP